MISTSVVRMGPGARVTAAPCLVDVNRRDNAVANDPVCAESRPEGVELLRADQIPMERVDWLWDGHLAAGKLHILAGQPGTGKTTIAMAMAATISQGTAWPGEMPAPHGDVLIWSGEDSAADTLVPRLVAAGADRSRIHFVGDVRDGKCRRSFDPAKDVKYLELKLPALSNLRLIIVDPIISAVSGDSHKGAEVRRGLQPLVDLAHRSGAAVLGITHFSKGTAGRDPVERVTGSQAFGALARVVLVTATVPEDQGGGALMIRAKANLAKAGGGIRYALTEAIVDGDIRTSKAVWGEAVDGDAHALLASTERGGEGDAGSRLDEAKEFLKEVLSGGRRDSREVLALAEHAGISVKTLNRAKRALGVKSKKRGVRDGCDWCPLDSWLKAANPATS